MRLQPGDLARGFPLFCYLFLIMGSYVVARAARDALFLDKYDPDKLPYVDIPIAVLVGFVVAGYIRLGRGRSLRNLLMGSLFFYASNCLLFWWLGRSFELPWLYPAIYVWVGMFGVLAVSQVWTLANYMLTTREAKRVFGVLASGATLATILGGLFVNVVVNKLGTESLFLAMAVAMLLCAGLVVLIWRQRRTGGTAEEERRESASQDAPRSLLQSLQLVRGSPHLLAIAGLILLAGAIAADLAVAAALRAGPGSFCGSGGAAAGLDRGADLGLALGGHRAAGQHQRLPVLHRQVQRRAALSAHPRQHKGAGEVVH
jgi:AAA family ATP:ADP antiporter